MEQFKCAGDGSGKKHQSQQVGQKQKTSGPLHHPLHDPLHDLSRQLDQVLRGRTESIQGPTLRRRNRQPVHQEKVRQQSQHTEEEQQVGCEKPSKKPQPVRKKRIQIQQAFKVVQKSPQKTRQHGEKQQVVEEKAREKQQVFPEKTGEKQKVVEEKIEEEQQVFQEKTREEQQVFQEKTMEKQQEFQEKTGEKQQGIFKKSRKKLQLVRKKSSPNQLNTQANSIQIQELIQERPGQNSQVPQEKSGETQQVFQEKPEKGQLVDYQECGINHQLVTEKPKEKVFCEKPEMGQLVDQQKYGMNHQQAVEGRQIVQENAMHNQWIIDEKAGQKQQLVQENPQENFRVVQETPVSQQLVQKHSLAHKPHAIDAKKLGKRQLMGQEKIGLLEQGRRGQLLEQEKEEQKRQLLQFVKQSPQNQVSEVDVEQKQPDYQQLVRESLKVLSPDRQLLCRQKLLELLDKVMRALGRIANEGPLYMEQFDLLLLLQREFIRQDELQFQERQVMAKLYRLLSEQRFDQPVTYPRTEKDPRQQLGDQQKQEQLGDHNSPKLYDTIVKQTTKQPDFHLDMGFNTPQNRLNYKPLRHEKNQHEMQMKSPSLKPATSTPTVQGRHLRFRSPAMENKQPLKVEYFLPDKVMPQLRSSAPRSHPGPLQRQQLGNLNKDQPCNQKQGQIQIQHVDHQQNMKPPNQIDQLSVSPQIQPPSKAHQQPSEAQERNRQQQNCLESPQANLAPPPQCYQLPSYSLTPDICQSLRFKVVDSHAHLDFIFNRIDGTSSDWSWEKLKTNFNLDEHSKFHACVTNFCDPKTWNLRGDEVAKLISTFEREKGIYYTIGCHPHSAGAMDHDCLKKMRALVRRDLKKKCVGIGECGLDRSAKNKQEFSLQEKAFKMQVRLAMSLKMPLVLHIREAEEEGRKILRQLKVPKNWPIHRHCFTGTWDTCQSWLRDYPGSKIGITNIVSDKRAGTVHEVVRRIPLHRLLLETDAPYFLPLNSGVNEPLTTTRGKRISHPMHILENAAQIAAIRSVSIDTILEANMKNCKQIYGIKYDL